MHELKRWRLKPFLFAVLFLFATVSTGFLNAQRVNANAQDVPNLLINNELYQKVSAHQHYWWLRSCFRNINIDEISTGEMAKWDIFEGTANSQILGGMYGSDNGMHDCQDENIVKTAFNYLGADSPEKAFCSLANTWWKMGDQEITDDATCAAHPKISDGDHWDMGGDTNGQVGTFESHFRDPGLSTAGEYLRAYTSFMQGCSIELSGKIYDKASDVSASGNTKYVVPLVLDNDGKIEVKYQLGIGRPDDQTVGIVEGRTSDTYKSCGFLEGVMGGTASAYRDYIDSKGYDTDTGEDGGGGNGSDAAVCSAGGLGWVLCPLSEALVETINQIADILQNLLIFQPLIGSTQGDAIKAIWNIVLGIANGGLVIGFLIIIFSQATSIGLSSYGIKKLLPRVIAAAILMNLSFYICAAAVDIANILGVSIKAIIDVGLSKVGDVSGSVPGLSNGATAPERIGVIATALLAAGIAIGTGAIFLLLPILVSALVAILTALLIIAARQVIITLLIIVAPLAMLAWLLPNTDEWFTKWRKLFTILLAMFPLIMLIFYGSVLVSSVILTAATGGANDMNNYITQLLAFLILIVPLFSLPFIMKTVGGILERFGALVNNRNKGLVDRSRKLAQDQYGARKETRRMNAFGEGRTLNPWKANMRRHANRDYRRNLRKGIAEENSQDYIARKALDGSDGRFGYAGRMAASGDPRYVAAVRASAQATVDKQERQSIANREILYKARLEPGNNDQITAEIQAAANKGDTVAVRALQNMYIGNGSSGIDAMRKAMNNLEATGASEEVLSTARKNLNENHGQKMKEKAYDMLMWSAQADVGSVSKGTLDQYSREAKTWDGLSIAEVASQSGGSVGLAVDAGGISHAKAQEMLTDKRVNERLSEKQIDHLRRA